MAEASRKMDKIPSWVNLELSSISDIKDKETEARERQSIYKLPTYVTNLNKNAYKPQAVSFGPYHFGDPDLMPNEAHKVRAFLRFLKRSGKSKDAYLSALDKHVQDWKGAYDFLPDDLAKDPKHLLDLMIRDGCFMLEILRASSTDRNQNTMKDYAHNDPVFSIHAKTHMIPHIKRDMLMLENQLPMLVLETLLAVENRNSQGDKECINQLILNFFGLDSFREELGRCLHVLDAYRKILLRLDTFAQVTQRSSFPRRGNHIISDARSLKEAGIRIKKSGGHNPRDINFDSHTGILRLPEITVDDSTETIFLNLIAFERFHAGAGNEVIDFCYLMDDIIDDAKDVKILENCGIIENAIGSDKAVAKLFNSLTKDVPLDADGSLTDVSRY